MANQLQKLRQHRAAMLGLAVLIVIALLCFIGPLFSPYNYAQQDLRLGATAPSMQHWLGTDILGRDLLSRILHGGRISFMVGFLATAVSILIGVSYGVISGYSGGRIDRTMMRIVEIIYSLPFVIFVILLVTVFGRQFWLMFIAIGAVEWLTMARIIRSQVLQIKQQTFVEAARSLGAGNGQIMRRHLLPNLIGTIAIYATLTIPNVMLLEAFISFLGLGVQAPMTSWGDLIRSGAEIMEEYPWALIFPSLFFSVTLLSLNFLGDGMRDAWDPRTKDM